MRWLKGLLLVIVAATLAYVFFGHKDDVSDLVSQYVENGEFLTLEARYTPQQIMESRKKELLLSSKHSFQEPSLKFYPYLLMEVKYLGDGKKTKEGVTLWSLTDGEMVLNTETWDTTHGFEDAINASATKEDFKVINAIAKAGGSMTKEQLQKELKLESESITPWIESAKQKQLIIQKGAELQLHFENPKLNVSPQTKLTQALVTKPYQAALKASKRYSKSQIERNAKAAFGQDFTVRNTTEVFLPVYSIEVLNPDGSLLTTYWNALNGQRIVPKYLLN